MGPKGAVEALNFVRILKLGTSMAGFWLGLISFLKVIVIEFHYSDE